MKVLTFASNDEGLFISNIGKDLDFGDMLEDLRGFTAFPTEHFLKVTRVEITVVLNKASASQGRLTSLRSVLVGRYFGAQLAKHLKYRIVSEGH